MTEQSSKIGTPKWLKRLQENSWEAEIIISGGAIFALLSFSDYLIDFIRQIKFTSNIAGTDIIAIFVIGALKGITIGFILHVILRGLWISLVCLNFSFPQGINFNRLKLSGKYQEKAQQFKLTDQIISLDHMSGLIFFASFAFVIVTIGITLFNTSLFTISNLIAGIFQFGGVDESDFFFLPINLLFLLFVVDLFSAGWLRRNRIVGKIYYPVYFILNLLSLAFIYRPWFQVLFSNINKWKALTFAIFFILITIAYTNVSLKRLFHWTTFVDQYSYSAAPNGGKITHMFYENRLGEDYIYWACIPSEIISGKYLRVFVPYRSNYDLAIAKANGEYFSDIVELRLNDTIQKADWIGITHEITKQRGMFAMLSIENLPQGKNVLKVRINSDHFEQNERSISFWKE